MAASNGFWSRRKAAVQAEELAEAAAVQAAADAAAAEVVAAEQAGKTDVQLLQELGLPDPDTLAKGDDFAAFMGRAVPEHMRRRALRKLWVSNPVLANLDGLVDHGEDYTDAATVIPGMQTAYQVGKGMLQHVIALAEAEAEAAVKAEPEQACAAEICEQDADLTEGQGDDMPPAEHVAARPPEPADAPPNRPRRHMRFEFSS